MEEVSLSEVSIHLYQTIRRRTPENNNNIDQLFQTFPQWRNILNNFSCCKESPSIKILQEKKTFGYTHVTTVLKITGQKILRDNSVSIVTCYGLDGPGIRPRCGRDFPHPSRPAVGPSQHPVQRVPGVSRG